jgi:malonate transporter and related proteins
MLTVLSIITPIFAIIAMGFLAIRSDFLPRDVLPSLAKLVLYFLLPALSFGTVAHMNFSEVIVVEYLLVYAGGGLLAQAIVLGGFYFFLKKGLSNSAIRALGSSMPNSMFVGLPVLMQAFDSPPLNAVAMAVMVENIVLLPVILLLAESGSANGGKIHEVALTVVKRVASNPIIVAIVCGLLVSALGIEIPEFINRTLTLLANGAAAVALFVIGGSLVGNSVRNDLRDIGLVAAGKLILHPLMAALLILLLPDFDRNLQLAAIMFAAMPMFSVYPIIGGNYGLRNFCASALLATTVASFFTISVILYLILD